MKHPLVMPVIMHLQFLSWKNPKTIHYIIKTAVNDFSQLSNCCSPI